MTSPLPDRDFERKRRVSGRLGGGVSTITDSATTRHKTTTSKENVNNNNNNVNNKQAPRRPLLPQTPPAATATATATARMYRVERIERLDDNLFVVHAVSRVKKLAVISRNIVVLRHQRRELTLVNPVKLDRAGLDQLLQLGSSIQRIIRLAPHHGNAHDRFYLTHFPHVRRWAPVVPSSSSSSSRKSSSSSSSAHYHHSIPVHRVLSMDDGAILPGCHVFSFDSRMGRPECALLILQDYVGNLLVTAQVLQSHRRNPDVNVLVRAQQAAQGLMVQSVVVPPVWLRTMQSRDAPRELLRNECERLLRLDFERLVSSSGVMVHQDAKENAVLAIEQAFPQW